MYYRFCFLVFHEHIADSASKASRMLRKAAFQYPDSFSDYRACLARKAEFQYSGSFSDCRASRVAKAEQAMKQTKGNPLQ